LQRQAHPRALIERLFYDPRVAPPGRLTRVWIEASAALPVGWHLSGVERNPDESWRAWALPGPFAGDPKAAPIEGHGGSVDQALLSLARNCRAAGGGPMRA
jgi:hypothetical protein